MRESTSLGSTIAIESRRKVNKIKHAQPFGSDLRAPVQLHDCISVLARLVVSFITTHHVMREHFPERFEAREVWMY